MRKHLVVSISGHGFGHVAQTAPVLNALHAQMPQLRITVRSSVTIEHLHARIHIPFTHLPSEGDIGMMMTSPLEVDVTQSRAAYHAFHADWEKRVADEACLLKKLHADMVFSNAGYLPLAGAQRAGILNAALCSLNWADIYRHYCTPTGTPTDAHISQQIQRCYADADAFLRATPGMAMDDLANLIPVAPIAAVGENRRDELNRHLGLSGDEKLVLVSMGGIQSRLPVDNWPRIDGVRYLVQANWQTRHPDAIAIESMPLCFSDLLASADALLCKPGYGSFVEAACCGVPVIYAGRPDWPESVALTEWLTKNGKSCEISANALARGNFSDVLAQLWHTPDTAKIIPAGAQQAAGWIAKKMS